MKDNYNDMDVAFGIPIINGRQFGERADACSYIYLRAKQLYNELINGHWYDKNRVTLMMCYCETEGCGDVSVEFDYTKNEVVWRNFSHLIRDLGYDALPVYTFDKGLYTDAIEHLKKEIERKCTPSMPNGYGVHVYKNGDKYRGQWRNNRRNGHGTYTSKYNGKYMGNWKNGKFQGYGVHLSKDGDKYTGSFYNDYQDGQGTMIYSNGDMYEGKWEAGQRHGYGKMMYADGSTYEGMWKEGKRYDCGEMRYTNNDKYVGDWENDKRHGYGRMVFADGQTQNGEWKNDELVT